MPWLGKSSSKEAKKKGSKEGFIDYLHRKFKSPSEGKFSSGSRGIPRNSDTVSELGSHSRLQSRSPSPTKKVSRCQSFNEGPHAQPLPLPDKSPAIVSRTDSAVSVPAKPKQEKSPRSSLFRPLPRPACIRQRQNPCDLDGESVSSGISCDSDDHVRSPPATDYDNGLRTAVSSPSCFVLKDPSSNGAQPNSKEAKKPTNISFTNQTPSTSPKRRPLGSHVPNLLVPYNGAFSSAPDSYMSSPSRSPMRGYGTEQVFTAGKTYSDINFLGSGQCSSPGSGHNSGNNSVGADMPGQLFWQLNRGSPEYSPIPSPRMTSPGPSSRIQSGAVTPIHPRSVGGTGTESQTNWSEEGRQQSHKLPLPPVTVSNSSPFSHSNSAVTSPSVPRSPGRAENPPSPGSRWKKGKLLGRGTFGHVYVGFNSESGEMCAMKEVTLVSDDAKSKESAKQLMQEIAMLSRLCHPNIVQYYGSETVGDRFYIYLEYVSGGSIYKLLQDYGQLGELALRNYTQQILSGLAYLHSKSTVHRDIKGANILVDPNGRVKLADFGMAKHIAGQTCPLSFKGSPYWMAPEVIKNAQGSHLAVDIWSLGCTVLEMATTKPPWSQYEGVAAMFKIGNSKELPAIPDHLSEEGKDFVRQCLQRDPNRRPTAAMLLEHPFVKCAPPVDRPFMDPEPSDSPSNVTNGVKSMGIGQQARNFNNLDAGRLAIHSSRVSKHHASEIQIPRNMSCPVSPIGSPLLYPRSPQHLSGRMSPSPISSPHAQSGSSTPLTGGNGAIPFGNFKQSPYMQYGNGSSYHDSSPDLFRAMQPGSHIFSDGRSTQPESYDGQLVLADRVSRQLLRDHQVKMVPSLDLSPNPHLP